MVQKIVISARFKLLAKARIELIKKAGYNLREDTLICIAKPNFFGAFNNKLKEVLICTKNLSHQPISLCKSLSHGF